MCGKIQNEDYRIGWGNLVFTVELRPVLRACGECHDGGDSVWRNYFLDDEGPKSILLVGTSPTLVLKCLLIFCRPWDC